MGAKASTAGNQSPPRTFSNSSSSDVVSAGNNASFNFLRAINGVETGDSRQRARSMSVMPNSDIHSTTSSNHNNNYNVHHHHLHQNAFSQPYQVLNGFAGAGAHFDLSNSPEESNSNEESQVHPLGIGRVVATSLPSHIWSLNGESRLLSSVTATGM